MKNLNLIDLAEKLEELRVKYGRLYPKFYTAELKYINKKSSILMGVMGLGAQPLRDAQVELDMAQTEEYEEYHKLFPEIDILKREINMTIQMSKNISNSNWSEVK